MSRVTKDQKFEILLGMYCLLDEWARKHGIKLFLDAGTCLGAVRHRGFIPWDFDLDVAVTWGYYNAMMKAWEEDPIPGFEIVNIFRYENYPSLFSRFVALDNTEIRRASAWDMAPTGMSIDIFPLIPLPVDAQKKQRAKDAFLVYYELMNPMMLNKRTRQDSMLKLLATSLAKEKVLGRKRVLSSLRSQFLNTPESECEDYIRVSAGLREGWAVTKAEIGSYAELPFEGHMAYVPERYITYLQSRYGVSWRNYPSNRAGGYHYVENAYIPYDVYVNDYMQFLDKDEIIKDFRALKEVDMRDAIVRPRIVKPLYSVTILPELKKLQSFGFPERYAVDVPADVEQAIDDYVAKQFSRPFSYWSIWGGMDDAWLVVACRMYFAKGDYHRAMKLINMRESCLAQPLAPELLDVRKEVNAIYRVYDDIDYGNYEAVREALETVDCLDEAVSAHASLFLKCHDASSEEDWHTLQNEAERLEKRFSGDYEFRRYRAVALAHLGKRDDAVKLLDDVIKGSNNGMTVLRAKDDREALGHE